MKAILLYTLLLLLSACYYDSEEALYGQLDQPCEDSLVSFAEHIFPIMDAACATPSCHASGGTGNGLLETYEQVKTKVDNGSMELRTLVNRDMPPSSPLTECQIDQLQSWIDAGAPNN